jgi:hypothetical protein
MMELSGKEQPVILNCGLAAGSSTTTAAVKQSSTAAVKMCKFDLLLALVANKAVKQQ